MTDLNRKQREVMQTLRQRGGSIPLHELIQICSPSALNLRELEKDGYLLIQGGIVIEIRNNWPAVH